MFDDIRKDSAKVGFGDGNGNGNGLKILLRISQLSIDKD
jgi:hypothetical protein